MKFALQNCDKISFVSFQPVSFTGRDEEITDQERHRKRYTLSHLAEDLRRQTGVTEPLRDWFPLSASSVLSRVTDLMKGPGASWGSLSCGCHPDCGVGMGFMVSKRTKEWAPLSAFVLFAAYVLWRFAETVWPEGDDAFLKRTGKRLGALGRALIYAGLTYSAFRIAFGSGSGQSQNAKAHQETSTALSWQYGTWIVGIAGGCLLAAGLYNAYRALTKKFTKRWNVERMGEAPRRLGERTGVVGLLARGVVFGLIGAFVIKAALEYDPKQAIGLDGALQKLAGEAYGAWLLGLTAAGLVAYAIFCFVEARYRRV